MQILCSISEHQNSIKYHGHIRFFTLTFCFERLAIPVNILLSPKKVLSVNIQSAKLFTY